MTLLRLTLPRGTVPRLVSLPEKNKNTNFLVRLTIKLYLRLHRSHLRPVSVTSLDPFSITTEPDPSQLPSFFTSLRHPQNLHLGVTFWWFSNLVDFGPQSFLDLNSFGKSIVSLSCILKYVPLNLMTFNHDQSFLDMNLGCLSYSYSFDLLYYVRTTTRNKVI